MSQWATLEDLNTFLCSDQVEHESQFGVGCDVSKIPESVLHEVCNCLCFNKIFANKLFFAPLLVSQALASDPEALTSQLVFYIRQASRNGTIGAVGWLVRVEVYDPVTSNLGPASESIQVSEKVFWHVLGLLHNKVPLYGDHNASKS
jgi:hypothetical protein